MRGQDFVAAIALAVIWGSSGPNIASAQRGGQAWTLRPEVEVTSNAGDLTTIGWVLPGRDGGVAIGQPKDRTVLFFDSAGALTSRFGRVGSGPGEFRSIGRAGWIGDTLWVDDVSQARITFISPSHQLVRVLPRPNTIRAGVIDSGPSARTMGILGVFADGAMLVSAMLPLTKGAPMPGWAAARSQSASPSVLVVASGKGAFQQVAGWTPNDECGLAMTAQYVNCARIVAEVAPDGSRLGFVQTSTVGANAGTYRVVVLRSNGDTLVSRRYNYTKESIPSSVLDSLKRLAASEPRAPGPLRGANGPPIPKVYPPVVRMLFGQDGGIWLELRPRGRSKEYVILGQSGAVVGRLTVPANVTIRAATGEIAWAVERDDDDLESVRRYRILKPK